MESESSSLASYNYTSHEVDADSSVDDSLEVGDEQSSSVGLLYLCLVD